MRTLLFAAIMLVASSQAQIIQSPSWKLDKAHSQANFSVSHLVIGEVTGRFNDFEVSMTSFKDDFADVAVEATIKSASIDTENEKRDGHLKSDDFLNAEKFPTIHFKSTSIEKTGDDAYKMTGLLTVRDVTQTVVLDVQYKGTIIDPWGNTRAAFRAATMVNRFDFGVKWSAVMEAGGFVAGEDVDITLIMEFVKQ